MTLSPSQQAELHDLVDAVCEAGLTAAALDRLEPMLLADDGACRYYLDYVRMHGALMLATEGRGVRGDGRRLGGSPPIEVPVASGQSLVKNRFALVRQLNCRTNLAFNIHRSSFSIPPLSPLPLPSPLGAILLPDGHADFRRGPADRLVVEGIGSIAHRPAIRLSPLSSLSPLPSVVGRITGMVDCQWAERVRVSGGLTPKGSGSSSSSQSQSEIPNLLSPSATISPWPPA